MPEFVSIGGDAIPKEKYEAHQAELKKKDEEKPKVEPVKKAIKKPKKK